MANKIRTKITPIIAPEPEPEPEPAPIPSLGIFEDIL